MKYKFKRAASSIRRTFNVSPTIITTSEYPCMVQVGSPSWQKGTTAYVVAEKTSSGLKKNTLWDISFVFDNRYTDTTERGVSFESMVAIMKAIELNHARQAGLAGTDEEVAALRRKAVPGSNILKLK